MSEPVKDNNDIIKKRCGCCGEMYELTLPPVSTAQGDIYDLDQRPPQPNRSVMYRQIFRCPRCGFVVGPKMRVVSEDFVLRSEYITCEGKNLPEGTGADFYRLGMTSEGERDYVNAFEAFLRAAWAFDDLGDDVSAKKCRDRCISMMDVLPGKNTYELLVRADIYRRAGRFSELPDRIRNARFPDGLSNAVLSYQIEKAAEGDTGVHTMKDVFDRLTNNNK